MKRLLRQNITLGLFFSLFFQLGAQSTITVVEKATLPDILTESSGVELSNLHNLNRIWSHNDSGGQPQLYEFDSMGTLIRTLTISNATNVDWEEVRRDTAGNFYACDFGNNDNERKDLKLYKIPNPDSIVGSSVDAQIINFHYPDQNAFPPSKPYRNFDMESMIFLHGSIYLFSKNRTDPYSGYSKLYRLPDTAGTYTAELLDSFYTGPGPVDLSSFTSADISPDLSTLVLISHYQLFLFTDFVGNHFFQGHERTFTFSGTLTHKEGVCFTSNTTLYLTDEISSTNGDDVGGKLYTCDLIPYLVSIPTGLSDVTSNSFQVYPNPSSGTFDIKDANGIRSIEIFDLEGDKILSVQNEDKNEEVVNLSRFPKGVYCIHLLEETGAEENSRIILK